MDEKTVLGHFSRVMQRLLGPDTPALLCAFSGGADSAALLTLLGRYRLSHPFPLLAVHVHHGIRGGEADRDEAFCAGFCEERGIPYRAVFVDVPAFAKEHRIGMEEAARLLRYEALDKVRGESGCAYLVTAHHAGDQTETVLHHLLRGSGLKGLCGMEEKRGTILRPLLSFPREELLLWNAENGVLHVEDSTNADTDLTRNYLRAEIVPRLKTVNPSLDRTVSTAVRSLREDSECLEALAASHSLSEGRKALGALPRAILLRVIRNECPADLSAVQLSDCADAAVSDKACVTVTLPDGYVFRAERDTAMILRPTEAPVFPPMKIGEGWQEWAGGEAVILFRRGGLTEEDLQKRESLQFIYNLSNNLTFDSAKMSGELFVRQKRPGDRIDTGSCTKEVRRLFSEHRLTEKQKTICPIFTDRDGIFWVSGFPPRGGYDKKANENVLLSFFDKKQND